MQRLESPAHTPRLHFVTFGNRRYAPAARRLVREATATRIFDGIHGYTHFPRFITSDRRWRRHVHISKGAGFWFWKAPLLKHVLNLLDDGDVLIYADSGCEIGDALRIGDIVEKLCGHDLISYSFMHTENTWTKGDVFAWFGVKPDDPFYGQSPQIIATYMAMRNSEQTRRFVQHWEDLMANITLVGDYASIAPNDPSFKEPRRDQSLFSMLVKANQPDCQMASDDCARHPVARRHPKYSVPGLRALIAKYEGYPPTYNRSLFMSARNPTGKRRCNIKPEALASQHVDAVKRYLGSCTL